MQTRVRKVAHVLERLGLAMAGAASGLFVAALVGTSHAALTNQAFLLVMMIGGAVGFYLGIDTPPLPFGASGGRPSDGCWVGKIDTPELLSAIGVVVEQPHPLVVHLGHLVVAVAGVRPSRRSHPSA